MKGGKTRDEMIESNMGLVHACARKFTGRGAEYEDLVQAGCVGLIKAVDNFDEGRGFLFSTYAVPVILGEIKRIFRDEGTVKCADKASYGQVVEALVGNQEIFDYLGDAGSTVAYAQNENQLSLTFWVTNE